MGLLTTKPWFADAGVIRRSRQVARVLTHHGLGTIVDHTGLFRFAPRLTLGGAPHEPIGQARRLRLALGELGATFTKLGQTLSTRADLLPPEFVTELSTLHDAAPPVPFAEVRRVLEAELGAPPEERFDAFDPEPLASASIGQAHTARRGGRDLVVKVRRPGVTEQIELDLRILSGIADWVQLHTGFGRDYAIRPLVDEFAFTLRNELDYVREGENADRMRRAFAGDPGVIIPRVDWERTTPSVLTLERVGGIKITDFATLDRLGIRRRAIAENAVRLYLRQLLDFGFFHADPHPGNFFVQPDASIAIVDFGMMGRLSEATQLHLLRGGLAALHMDPEALAEELYALGVAGRRADRSAFQRDLDHVLARYGGRSLRDLSAADVTAEITSIAFRHRLQLPTELALLFRVVSMSEGLGLQLDPEFHYLEFASPLFRKRWRQRFSMRATLKRLERTTTEAVELGSELPRRAGRLLARAERGEMELNVRHEGLERFATQLQHMTNRLALAVILAASVVAMAVALGARGGEAPAYLDWLFRLGLAFSLIFGVVVLWSIWRARR